MRVVAILFISPVTLPLVLIVISCLLFTLLASSWLMLTVLVNCDRFLTLLMVTNLAFTPFKLFALHSTFRVVNAVITTCLVLPPLPFILLQLFAPRWPHSILPILFLGSLSI